ncbi:hypothetical protein KL86DPRO_10784 [uncultured delta proteobacterium]|uniref:Uncharacterized protein n=1 Tax=uncultured delta proteobacterium TaxID=34034 RepID=A0A212J6U6_9DELT|nr:hypothetical protein KL86DPRO_10784 [uncultured delta proteobacterium]
MRGKNASLFDKIFLYLLLIGNKF